MLLCVIFVSVALASATSPVKPSPPSDRPLPPGCRFPSGPYVPPECPPNEYFEVCSYKCPSESCYPDEPCDPGDGCCSNACRCNEGYCRNREGICVSSSENGPGCQKRCRPTCRVPNPKNCIPNPKCTYCGDGKVFDEDKGTCVDIIDCPFDQGCNGDINAGIRQYPAPCPSTCSEPEELPCKRKTESVGCACNSDYILSKVGGKCIKADNCPGGNPCGVNGTLAYCKVDCPSDYCAVDDGRGQVICDPAMPCRSGCICKYRYQRKSTEDNTCILAQECPEIPCTSRPYEEWNSCPFTCFSDYCDTYNQPPLICPTFAIPECNPQCVCKKGYARDENDICIKGEKCPGYCESKNATYSTCLSACPPTCELPNGPQACIAVCRGEGCACKKGYVLYNGNCIKVADCPPPKCGPNSTYKSCPSACPKTCALPNGPEVCTAACPVNGCECNKGYVLNNGKCIKVEECPPGNCESKNATYSTCLSACPPTCELPNGPQACIAVCRGEGCACKKGYVLYNGNCIKVADCPPPKCGPNSTYKSCPSACPKTCALPNGPEVCTAACPVNGCECNKGYVLNNGKCIKVEECPPGNCESKNATYSTCLSACPPTCELPNGPDACIAVCKGEGCACNKGYVLYNGNCIKVKDCPPPKCGPNSTYKSCPSACPKTCALPNGPEVCTAACPVNGCECNKGYVLTKGKCIKVKDCPLGNCESKNATYSTCLSACPRTCELPNGPDACIAVCKGEGCACNKGYVLYNGNCIKVEDCPPPKCGPNSTYKSCPSACPKTCALPNGPEVCTAACPVNGCECNKGYVLNNGKCIKVEECPPGNCESKNATYSTCLSACPPTCELPNGPDACIAVCKGEGCACNKGYVLYNGNCIKVKDCPPPKCGPNSTYKSCPSACPKTCALPNGPEVCTAACPVNGCECNKGYVLNKGKCIKVKDCPPGNCESKNATYSTCLSACPRTCELPNGPDACIAVCKGEGCACNKGYVLYNGNCIKVKDCPPPKCGPNSTYKSCPSACPKTCALPNGPEVCTAACPVNGCECNKGYVLNKGKCIKVKDCPPGNCESKNATYSTCLSACPRTCELPNGPDACIAVCKGEGCACNKGYVLYNGNCIKVEDCPPPKCKANSTYKTCPSACPKTCEEPNGPEACPDVCLAKGCECNDGFVLNAGQCIEVEDCPPQSCPDE